MSIFTGEVGLQFTTHIANHYTVPEWIELAEDASPLGIPLHPGAKQYYREKGYL